MFKKSNKLTGKQRRFCEEYLKDLNGTQAYYRAGYSAKNDNVASTLSYDLLRKPEIAAYIQELQRARGDRTAIDSDRVLKEYANVALSRITDVLSFTNEDLTLFNSDDLPDSVKAAIQSVSLKREEIPGKKGVTVITTKTVRMHDKLKALEMLGRHTGLSHDLNWAIATLQKYYGKDGVEVASDLSSVKAGKVAKNEN